MKIRQGFVSNSSTTSFCIYGASVSGSYEELEERLEDTNLHVEYTPWDNIYVGRSWSKIGDDETGAQFKADVKQQVEQLFGKTTKCNTIEMAWRD